MALSKEVLEQMETEAQVRRAVDHRLYEKLAEPVHKVQVQGVRETCNNTKPKGFTIGDAWPTTK